MMDGWYVPGGAVINDDLGRLRICPPTDWRRDLIVVERRPLSMNDNKIRSHWYGFHELKKSWQEEIEILLMIAKMPRGNKRAAAGAVVRFERRLSRPPDPGNYAGLINKALGDAMTNYGAIPDDDDAHYFFGGVEFESDKGTPQTTILIYTQP